MDNGKVLTQQLAEKWVGDFDAILQRKKLRVLVPYSKTFYFIHDGKTQGLAVEWLHGFEKHLKQQLGDKAKGLTIFVIPTRRDRIIPDLVEGRGDLAIANMTVTDKRREKVDFSSPFQKDIREVVITQRNHARLSNIYQLSGKEIHVRESSSYFQSLQKLNRQFKRNGMPLIKIVKTNALLEDEDLLEMVHAELIPAIIMDSHKAAFWTGVMSNVRVHPKVAVRKGANIAWAFRKDSPQLKARVNTFAKTAAKGTALGNILLKRYYKQTKWLNKTKFDDSDKSLQELTPHFKKYGSQYNIDWRLLAAVAFKESRLNQSVVGPTGAVGVMQIHPNTASSKSIGVANVDSSVEANIHAGAKYLRYLVDQFYAGEEIDDFNRILFSLASYNAGPGRIAAIRKKVSKPNIWFDQVEHAVARHVNQTPVRYVRGIYKYYVALKNHEEGQIKRRAAQDVESRKLRKDTTPDAGVS